MINVSDGVGKRGGLIARGRVIAVGDPAEIANDKFGGPQASGVWSGPTIPSSPATFVLPAKNGSVRLILTAERHAGVVVESRFENVGPADGGAEAVAAGGVLDVSAIIDDPCSSEVDPLKAELLMKLSVLWVSTRPFKRTANDLV